MLPVYRLNTKGVYKPLKKYTQWPSVFKTHTVSFQVNIQFLTIFSEYTQDAGRVGCVCTTPFQQRVTGPLIQSQTWSREM